MQKEVKVQLSISYDKIRQVMCLMNGKVLQDSELEQQKKELEIALTSYISLKHNQDECSGFIDGFKEALSLFAVSGQSEQFVCEHLHRTEYAHLGKYKCED